MGRRKIIKVKRFDIVLVSLDPTIGAEIKKTRPCIIISPDEMNTNLKTVIIAPLTSKGVKAPYRVPVKLGKVPGKILLDQIRTIDKKRIVKILGKLDKKIATTTSKKLVEMFL